MKRTTDSGRMSWLLAAAVSIALTYVVSFWSGSEAQEAPVGRGSSELIAGTWSGTAVQPGFGRYPMTMSIASPERGNTDYPTLNCGGTLRRFGSASSLTYIETIVYGADRCYSGGTITLMVLGVDELQWEYWHPAGVTATARLNRISG